MRRTSKWLAALILCSAAMSSRGLAEERDPGVSAMQPGVQLTLVAEHPQLVTPTGIDVDEESKIWLAVSHTHFPPDDYPGPKYDEILVFTPEGTRNVFYDTTFHTMDLELGKDGWVYLAERDRILRVKDTDGDGRGDVEEDLAVLDTTAVYPHNGLAGLAWHPHDGDLLFSLGDNHSERWTLVGRDGASVTGIGEGGVFRCNPDGTQMRRIAKGMWNPFGVCVRDNGDIFAVDNDPGERPPCRLLHIVENGHYGYQRKYGNEAHHPFVCWNGQLRGTLPMIHRVGEAPCGIVPLGAGFIISSWSDHCLNFHPLRRDGASYASDKIPLVQGQRYFRPACIAPGSDPPDARTRTWYLTDWVDGRYEVHGYGRLWKLEVNLDKADWIGAMELPPPTAAAVRAEELRSGAEKFDFDDLLQCARDEDPFVAHAALVGLARGTNQWSVQLLDRLSPRDRISVMLALRIAIDDRGATGIAVDPWVEAFLADDHPEVLFEVLRWIADSELARFLPKVEQILRRDDLDYRLFEAAVAAWNTLNGRPEDGVRHPEMLLERVADADAPASLRAYALRLLPGQPRSAGGEDALPTTKFPSGLTVDLLRELLEVGDPLLSREVIHTLAGNPVAGQKLLVRIASDSHRQPELRAEAVAALAGISERHLDLLIRLAGAKERAVREEALRGLRGTTLEPEQLDRLRAVAEHFPRSADLVEAVTDPESLTSDRPDVTNIAAWRERIDELPGKADVDAGERIFHHVRVGACSRCHRHYGRGNVVGPDLSAVDARRERDWLLESILQPSRDVAPEFRPTLVLLEDGRTFTGIRLRSSTREAMRDSNGLTRTFDRSEIEVMRELNQSFMPEKLVHLMTDRELRDLMAFLESPGDDAVRP